MRVIALEGSSFAGKSTLAKQLSDHFDAPVIGEYIDFAPDGFPPFATTRNELEEQVNFFVDLERKRKAALDEQVQKGCPLAIIDRTAATLVAFQAAMDEITTDDTSVWDPELMHERIVNETRLGRVIIPQLVLVLTSGSKTEHAIRVHTRGEVNIPTLNDWNFSERVREITRTTCADLFPQSVVTDHVTDSLSMPRAIHRIERTRTYAA